VNELHYWNRANFEGLASLSSALRGDSRLERLAAYCDLREKGLRREAFAQLDTFLEQVRSWEVPVQRGLALQVLDAHWRTPQAHQFMTDPLRKRFLERVLEQWRGAEANNPTPLRYLALLRRDRDLLEAALRMSPKDDVVRAALAGILIGLVDYATHHLVEGKFIGDEGEAFAALAEAASLVAGVTDASSASSLKRDLEGLDALLTDWREYRQAPEGTFPEWCRARNRTHRWWNIVYYKVAAQQANGTDALQTSVRPCPPGARRIRSVGQWKGSFTGIGQ
jgi:hypothetical protein